MRCDQCGREMRNAELWQLAGDPNAPTSSSMRHLCWECRNKVAETAEREADTHTPIIEEAAEVARRHESTHESTQA